MSYVIGKRINEIRLEKKITQEEIASVLGISRQRVARIENGQSDISYEMIKKVANYFAVSVASITSVGEENDIQMHFRDVNSAVNVDESVEKIVDILKTFRAHEKLFYRMKGELDEV